MEPNCIHFYYFFSAFSASVEIQRCALCRKIVKYVLVEICNNYRNYPHQINVEICNNELTHTKSTMDTATMNSDTNTDTVTTEADQKIINDLNILIEKMDQCQSQLNEQKMGNSNVFRTTNALYDIVGFLEACAPRMVELVEFCATQQTTATTTAPLSDIVLMKALDVNDRLIKTLSDLDQVTFQNDTTPDTETATPPSDSNIQQSSSEDEFDEFLSVRTNEAATTNDDLLS